MMRPVAPGSAVGVLQESNRRHGPEGAASVATHRSTIPAMGKAVRRVPAHWKHPTDDRGNYIPLRDGAKYEQRVREWDEGAAKWQEGLQRSYDAGVWQPLKAEYRG